MHAHHWKLRKNSGNVDTEQLSPQILIQIAINSDIKAQHMSSVIRCWEAKILSTVWMPNKYFGKNSKCLKEMEWSQHNLYNGDFLN